MVTVDVAAAEVRYTGGMLTVAATIPPTMADTVGLPLGHAFTGSESFQVEPGQTVERGGVRFTCTGATACMVTVDVAAAEVRYTGGMLTVARRRFPRLWPTPSVCR